MKDPKLEYVCLSQTFFYLDGFQYQKCEIPVSVPMESNRLLFFPHAEGYIENNNGKFRYVYHYTDHLGNIRVSYIQNASTGLPSILKGNNYYPFGLKHSGYDEYPISLNPSTENNYKYNGKELQTELGLNIYDYGARNYDPALGRWFNIDPLAEVSRRWSPYTYAYNNSIYFIDPDGMMPTYDWGTGKYMGGDQEIAYEDAIAYYKSNSPPDDITVNKQGIATKVFKKGKPNRFFDEKGNRLYFNDPKGVDKNHINGGFYEIGSRVYYPITKKEVKNAIEAVLLNPNIKFQRTVNLLSNLQIHPEYLAIAISSWTDADFTFSFFQPKYDIYNVFIEESFYNFRFEGTNRYIIYLMQETLCGEPRLNIFG